MPASNTHKVEGLFVGQSRHRWAGKPASSIDKFPASGRQSLTLIGFEKDQQADLTVHGGPDKAVHHYAADHYAAWQAEGFIAAGTQLGAFGENISTYGLLETEVCIGDIFRFGTALVQISQGRQPCWKLNLHTENDQMAYLFQKTLRTGWYYRVLEVGIVARGDEIRLVERPQPKWTVAQVTHARLTKKAAPSEARALAQLPELAEGWRWAFSALADGTLKEDTSKRLG